MEKHAYLSLVKTITERIPVRSIYLFGSRASGSPNADSDIDLCVITRDEAGRKLDLMREIRKVLMPLVSGPLDILVFGEREFLERAALTSTLEHTIARDGVKLFG